MEHEHIVARALRNIAILTRELANAVAENDAERITYIDNVLLDALFHAASQALAPAASLDKEGPK